MFRPNLNQIHNYITISHTRIVKIAKKVGQINKSYNMFNRSIVFTGEKGVRPHGINTSYNKE